MVAASSFGLSWTINKLSIELQGTGNDDFSSSGEQIHAK
jgi:hypothetical protein